jgi:hypothetical protein
MLRFYRISCVVVAAAACRPDGEELNHMMAASPITRRAALNWR